MSSTANANSLPETGALRAGSDRSLAQAVTTSYPGGGWYMKSDEADVQVRVMYCAKRDRPLSRAMTLGLLRARCLKQREQRVTPAAAARAPSGQGPAPDGDAPCRSAAPRRCVAPAARSRTRAPAACRQAGP